jgi:hypothetical protein
MQRIEETRQAMEAIARASGDLRHRCHEGKDIGVHPALGGYCPVTERSLIGATLKQQEARHAVAQCLPASETPFAAHRVARPARASPDGPLAGWQAVLPHAIRAPAIRMTGTRQPLAVVPEEVLGRQHSCECLAARMSVAPTKMLARTRPTH